MNRLPLLPTRFACALAVALSACTPQLIPNTDLEDTTLNRDLVAFCEQYRLAVEKRDVQTLLSLAHQDYYEDGGNVDATDDLDYAGLRDYLQQEFVNARSIRYEIRYRRVQRNERNGWDVAYTYSASYQLPDGKGDQWHREVAENQLVLVSDGEGYKILSGM